MKKLQDDWSHMQKEWAEGKRELEVERSHSRDLIFSRDKAVKDATDRIEASGKELADAIKTMEDTMQLNRRNQLLIDETEALKKEQQQWKSDMEELQIISLKKRKLQTEL
ncbi:hypothetical protein AXG93_4391s1000 [Marchantia polymorpha subsp. ruderalis]|uniref:Uncharacterized protein n=1 Tax=Marchantia polymorpha subsp. ruderalis TaxID=1480154 RepID=A0A176WQV9_MARPO|nr:hypothetical protein AXG93_4391s1000 [Marchantia polymorpha subsp. ruderalis]